MPKKKTSQVELQPTRHRGYFTRVESAREALKARAYEILKLYIHNAKLATKKGDYDTAKKSYQWLMEHMPPDAGGERVVVHSVDKAVEVTGKLQPSVSIGFTIGGLVPNKQLKAGDDPVVVDITPIKEKVEKA